VTRTGIRLTSLVAASVALMQPTLARSAMRRARSS
jgi:hypothetical protein